MTDNTRFQPGDKVRVGLTRIWAADLGLSTNVTYTVAHVDDFGQVSLRGISTYYHPSHFELVMRAVADETYCLLDGEGDWWILDEAPDAVPVWRMVDRPDVLHDVEDGIEQIEQDYGIKALPTAPAETYALKDEDGDWWAFDVPSDTWTCVDNTFMNTRTGLEAGADDIVSIHGIDTASTSDAAAAELRERLNGPADTGNSTGPSLHFEAVPLQPGDRARIVRTWATDASHGIADGMRGVGDEFTVTEVGTNSHGPYAKGDDVYWWHPEDLEKVTDPAPLAAGDWVKVLARVEQVYDNGSIKARTYQSEGASNGRVFAIASAITRTDEVPEWVEAQKVESEAISNITATLRREGGMDYDAAHEVAASLFRAGVTMKETN